METIEALLQGLKPGEFFLHEDDCRKFLALLPEHSVEAVVTDPPYELGFMGQGWDRSGIAFDASLWAEVLRILKPGGHLLAAGIGRTHHRMMVAVEDAGFEIRDCIYHIFGSGFPKNLDVSKAIDRLKGAKRPIVGRYASPEGGKWDIRQADNPSAPGSGGMFTAPATEEAASWKGWGTALKPAVEIWVLARKPLFEASVTENVLKWGTGALNIDACRIAGPGGPVSCTGTGWASQDRKNAEAGYRPRAYYQGQEGFAYEPHPLGRWPANLILSHSEECVFKGYKRIRGNGTSKTFHGPYGGASATGFLRGWSHSGNQHADSDGTELVEEWDCVPGCPVRALDEQSSVLKSGFMKAGTVRSNLCGYQEAMFATTLHGTYGDSGGASRFFYHGKVSRSERWSFCRDCNGAVLPEELENHRGQGHHIVMHPTQKPLGLMRWLVRLVTPPGGLVLDPFAGSGTTLTAAVAEGFRAVGCECDPEYVAIARARLGAVGETGGFRDEEESARAGGSPASVRQMRLPLVWADEGQR